MIIRTAKTLLLFVMLFALLSTAEAKNAKKPAGVPPTYKHVHYGPDEAQVINFWKVKSDKPTPLLVHIHGGGWLGGKIGDTAPASRLDKGYSYAEVEYRLAGKALLPAPVHDAARAIQFIRSKAKEWNIDTSKIVLTGGSAGAATSMWLAFHDDLADPKSKDLVARESTRVAGIRVASGQSTLDPFLLEKEIGPACTNHPMIWKTLGAESIDELKKNWDKYKKLSAEFSSLNFITKDDPVVYLTYRKGAPTPVTKGDGIHHERFGTMVKEKCDKIGLKCHLIIHGHEKYGSGISADEYMERIFFPEKFEKK